MPSDTKRQHQNKIRVYQETPAYPNQTLSRFLRPGAGYGLRVPRLLMERRSSLSVTMARACQGRLKLPARESLRVDRLLEEEEELEREEEVELARLCDCEDDDEEDEEEDDDEVEDAEEEGIVMVVVVVMVPDRLC